MLRQIQKQIEEARERYLQHREAKRVEEADAASEEVKRLQADLALEISSGAKPCPFCGVRPHGMERHTATGQVDYEIGCLTCPPFKDKHGVIRSVRARGGIIPRQTVEAWNEGPDYWCVVRPR